MSSNDRTEWSRSELCSFDESVLNPSLSRRMIMASTGAGILGGLLVTGTVAEEDDDRYHLKSRPTMWTDEDRENAQANIERYDWAKDERDSAVDSADGYLEEYAGDADDPDLDALWSLVTSQKVPRGGGVAAERDTLGGTSSSGTDRRFKVETAVDNPHGDGNFVLPTNDFEAYRQSGLDDRGMFDPDLADDDLLVNEEHPEMGEGWGVDDGYGWIDEDGDLGHGEGHRWNVVAFHNHWFTWRPGGIRRIIVALTEAYLLTGETKYAIPGLVMLDRLADVYPEMWTGVYRQKDGFWNNTGGLQTGKIIGSGWEGNLQLNLMPAYDVFFPALNDDAVADEVLGFLQGKSEEFPGLTDKDSVRAIRENIEENWIQEIHTAAKDADLRIDRGMRPSVAMSARIQDDVREDGYTREALEWLFQAGDEIFEGDVWNEEPEKWRYTGGQVLTPIVNVCDRDGYWHEAAPGYNGINMSNIRQVADVLMGYEAFEGADLYQHPKFQQALKQNSGLLLLDGLTPEIGNQHSPTGTAWSTAGVQDGYEVTGDAIFAQLWHRSNGYSTAGIRGSIYDEDPEGLDDDLQSIIDAKGPLDLPSQNLAGYGFAALRDGENHTIGADTDVTLDTSELFTEASTAIDDSFDEAIQLEGEQEGEWWSFEFEAPQAGMYDVTIDALFGPDSYGIYELYVNDEHVDTVDFFADGDGRDTLTYTLELADGTNEMRWENIGKNEDANEYKMALYSLGLDDDVGVELDYDTSELFVEASADIDDSFDDAIQFEPDEEGDWWTFEFDVPEGGSYELDIHALWSDTYGIYDLEINGEHVDTVDFYDSFSPGNIIYKVDLVEGTNEMRWELVGTNEDAGGQNMALYDISLADEAAREESDSNHKRAFWLYYGRNNNDAGGTAHNHADTLNLGVAAHDIELSPDLGYPEQTGSWPKRLNWTENTISHNTVVVDESKQDPQWAAHPRHFEGGDERVNLIDVEAPHAYRHCDEYRRTTAMITVDEEHSYAVDLFRVVGGNDHVFSFHGAPGESSAEGVDLVEQDSGTYAGEDVPKPGHGENTEYNQEVGSGFNYLTNVARDDNPGSKVAVEFDLEDFWGYRDDDAEEVHMRLTSFGDFDEVALADGHPPQLSGNPETMPYALLRRQGDDVESAFLSIIEHFEGERIVDTAEQVPVEGGDGHAVKVELTTGRTDYVVIAPHEDDVVVVDDTFRFKGFLGVYCEEDGESEYAYVHDGTKLEAIDSDASIDESQGFVGGAVRDFTREMTLENELEVQLMRGRQEIDRHAGFVYVDNDDSNPWRDDPDPKDPIGARGQRGRGNGAYPIETISSERANRYIINVGQKTFTRDFVDADQLEEGGYHYVIDEDDDVRIPLSSSWSAD